jgi:pro-apoptotic serine protease NMA111
MNGASPTSRSKRKQSSHADDERPHKHYRPLNGKASPGDNTPDVDLGDFELHEPVDDEVLLPYQPQPGDTVEWQATIEKVVRNVVSIRFCQTCSFDTDAACASEATGFVVDAEKG